jgi:hypothetical protein
MSKLSIEKHLKCLDAMIKKKGGRLCSMKWLDKSLLVFELKTGKHVIINYLQLNNEIQRNFCNFYFVAPEQISYHMAHINISMRVCIDAELKFGLMFYSFADAYELLGQSELDTMLRSTISLFRMDVRVHPIFVGQTCEILDSQSLVVNEEQIMLKDQCFEEAMAGLERLDVTIVEPSVQDIAEFEHTRSSNKEYIKLLERIFCCPIPTKIEEATSHRIKPVINDRLFFEWLCQNMINNDFLLQELFNNATVYTFQDSRLSIDSVFTILIKSDVIAEFEADAYYTYHRDRTRRMFYNYFNDIKLSFGEPHVIPQRMFESIAELKKRCDNNGVIIKAIDLSNNRRTEIRLWNDMRAEEYSRELYLCKTLAFASHENVWDYGNPAMYSYNYIGRSSEVFHFKFYLDGKSSDIRNCFEKVLPSFKTFPLINIQYRMTILKPITYKVKQMISIRTLKYRHNWDWDGEITSSLIESSIRGLIRHPVTAWLVYKISELFPKEFQEETCKKICRDIDVHKMVLNTIHYHHVKTATDLPHELCEEISQRMNFFY